MEAIKNKELVFEHNGYEPGAWSYRVHRRADDIIVSGFNNIQRIGTDRVSELGPVRMAPELWDEIYRRLLADDAPDHLYRCGVRALSDYVSDEAWGCHKPREYVDTAIREWESL